MYKRMFGVIAIVVAAALSLGAHARQLATQDLNTLTVEDLVASILGGDVTILDVTFNGAPVAAGTFTGGKNTVGCDSGIILSTGNVANVIAVNGMNNSDATSASNGMPGDPDLDALIPGFTTFDAAILEITFQCEDVQSISFKYVFASEEYNEFVNSSFNDVFGFFLNGENIALLPDGVTPVSINNVNCGGPVFGDNPSNCEFYINNDCTDLPGAGSFPCVPAVETEMDGLTVVLTAAAPVNPGVNTIKLAIADAGDSILDSVVFICAESFICGEPDDEPPPPPPPPGCGQVTNETVTCVDDDDEDGFSLLYSFDVTNLSGVTATHLLVPPFASVPNDDSVTVEPHVIALTPPLPSGGSQTATISLDIAGELIPNQEICVTFALFGFINGEFAECCGFEQCFTVPPCDCWSASDLTIQPTCLPGGEPAEVDVAMTLTNEFGDPVQIIFLIPVTKGVTFEPDAFVHPGLAHGESTIIEFTAGGVVAGEEVCLLMSMHDESLNECCAEEFCFTVPDCDDGVPEVCGEPDAGECCRANGTPGCDDEECCAAVCAIEPECCEKEWDEICVALADAECRFSPDSSQCDYSVHTTWEALCCPPEDASANVTICNQSGSTQTYAWTVVPVPVGESICSWNLDAGAFEPPSGVMTVGPGQCGTDVFAVACHEDQPLFTHGCFNVAVQVLGETCGAVDCPLIDATGATYASAGWKVFPVTAACGSEPCDPLEACAPALMHVVPFCTTQRVRFRVINAHHPSQKDAVIFRYQFGSAPSSAMDDKMEPDFLPSNPSLTLDLPFDGNPAFPPGVNPPQQQLIIPLGQCAIIEVDVAFVEHDPFVFHDILVSFDADNDGTLNGPGASTGVVSLESPFGDCLGDLNNDGTVGVQDLLILLANFGSTITCIGDLDGNGVVGVSDLLLLLANWGECPR